MRVLILASNPRKDLHLDREIRDLKEVIQKSRNHQDFAVDVALAVRVGDLHDLLFQHRPQIVHFCGHGSGQQGLVFEGNDGGEQWVRADALSNLFRLFAQNVDCVLLNACYSEEQATAIVHHIDYVIGMNQEIRDDAAIAFAKGFYRALGYACAIEEAFEFGCNAIQLEISGSSRVRSAVSEPQRKLEVADAVAKTVIPEHLKPILKKRPTLIAPTERLLSEETRTAIQLEVDRSLDEEEASLTQFREQVREYLQDHQLADYERDLLDALQEELGLSQAEADRIVEEEFAPIRQAQQAYKNRLVKLSKYYPFNEAIQRELKKFQQQRNLTDAEVNDISQPILEQAEAEYQERLRQREQQEYEQKLQRYQQAFRVAVQTQYPLTASARAQLQQLQRSLGLSNEDIARIEEPIATPKERAYQQQLAQQQQQEQQREAARRQALKRQQELEEAQRREAAKRRPPLQSFEFQVPTVNIGGRTIEKPGWLGKKTETVTTVNVAYQPGRAEYFVEELGNGVILEMVAIAGGSFLMGSPSSEQEHLDREGPQHHVTVQPFFMGKFAVTQAQWKTVAALARMNQDLDPAPSRFKGDRRPVEQVSWHDAVEFCDRLSQKTGKPYRLPSEAEWEYACRAGTTTPFYCGETITTDLANYNGNYTYGSGTKGVYREQTKDVGGFSPNGFGLYDMHGNVWEWCVDHWHENYEGAPIDGSAWITDGDNDLRLLRGGSWSYNPRFCRSAYRYWFSPGNRDLNFGFRVVCAAAWTS
jgi:formylglycine-generating enzyme required for sulfatase activity